MLAANTRFDAKLALLQRTPIYKIEFAGWDDTYSTQKIKSNRTEVDEADTVSETFTISESKVYSSTSHFPLINDSPIGDMFPATADVVIGDSLPYLNIPSGLQGQVYPEEGHASIGQISCVITDYQESITELVASGVIGRRVIVSAGFEGIDEDEFVTVFTGLVQSVRLTSDFAGFEFQFNSPQTLTNRTIFNLASASLLEDMTAEADYFVVATPDTFTDTSSPDTETWALIEDELVFCKPADDFATSGIMGILATRDGAVEHAAGAGVRQVLRIGPGHPVAILLRICQETAPRYGLSMDAAFLDFAGLTAASDVLGPDITMDFQITEAQNAMEFFEREIYRPCGAYPFVTADGKLSMKAISEPADEDSVETIDHDSIVTDADGRPMLEWSMGWDSNLGQVINRVTFNMDYNPATGNFESTAEFRRQSSIDAYGDFPIVIDARGLRIAATGTLEFIEGRALAILNRSESGIPLITASTFLQKELIEPGDIVSLSSSLLPDRFTKGRGLTNSLMEVVNRTLHWDTGQVEMQLLMTSFGNLAGDDFERDDVTWNDDQELGTDNLWSCMAQDHEGIHIEDGMLYLGRLGVKKFGGAQGNGVMVRSQVVGPNQQSELVYSSTTGAGAFSGPAVQITYTYADNLGDPYLDTLSGYAAIYDYAAGEIKLQMYFGTDPTASQGATLASYPAVLLDGDRLRIRKRNNILRVWLNDEIIIDNMVESTLAPGAIGAISNWQGTAGGSLWHSWRGSDTGFA